ncbi:MAG TPA: DNA-binding protein [Candidatus Hydrogenedentes bacterium]|nr:DNA-binding protein [Candidatus Hydrogenedentota bacterium]
MKTLSIKNVPDELYLRLQAQAQQNHRSVNREVVAMLDTAIRVKEKPEDKKAVLEEMRLLRARVSGPAFTLEEIQQAIDEGRP